MIIIINTTGLVLKIYNELAPLNHKLITVLNAVEKINQRFNGLYDEVTTFKVSLIGLSQEERVSRLKDIFGLFYLSISNVYFDIIGLEYKLKIK